MHQTNVLRSLLPLLKGNFLTRGNVLRTFFLFLEDFATQVTLTTRPLDHTPPLLGIVNSKPRNAYLVDVSDIFYFFSARGRGKGESKAPRRGVRSLIKETQEGGWGLQDGRGRGAVRVCGELGNFLGGGGAKYFFRGRNVHQAYFQWVPACEHNREGQCLQVPVKGIMVAQRTPPY